MLGLSIYGTTRSAKKYHQLTNKFNPLNYCSAQLPFGMHHTAHMQLQLVLQCKRLLQCKVLMLSTLMHGQSVAAGYIESRV